VDNRTKNFVAYQPTETWLPVCGTGILPVETSVENQDRSFSVDSYRGADRRRIRDNTTLP